LLAQVVICNDAPVPPAQPLGVYMDGQAEFYMPAHAGGGKRRADGAWMTNAKYLAIPAAIRMTKALHFVVPDFIIENKSYGLGFNNTLVFQKLKMNNWILAGVQFGILILCGTTTTLLILCRTCRCSAIGGWSPTGDTRCISPPCGLASTGCRSSS